MGKDEKSDVLRNSLQEILKDTREDVPVEPLAKPVEEESSRVWRKPQTAGLLDTLLSEVKREAEREVQEITKTLEERTAQEKQAADEEEARKRAQYEKLIREEAKRRLQLIKRKEEEKKRKIEEEKLRAERKRIAEIQLARAKRNRKIATVLGAVAGVVVITIGVLGATGVIPMFKGPEIVQTQSAAVSPAVPVVEKKKEKEPRQEESGPVIVDSFPAAESPGIDGPAAPIIEIEGKTEVSWGKLQSLPPSLKQPDIRLAQMRSELARAFSDMSSSSGSRGSGSEKGRGGIKIDDSIFKD